MRALLDQENWSEIDVPDEFQVIVNSLCSSESVISGESGGASDDTAVTSSEVVSSSDGPSESDAGPLNTSQSVERPDSNGTYTDPLRSSVPTENSNADVSTSSNGNNASTKERGKSALRMLYFKGVAYHMVNW